MHKNLFVGAGGPDKPTTTDDNLQSEDIVEFALAISEGPIRGLTEGAKSFMVGDTPLIDANGERNYEKFAIGVHPGYPEGSVKPLALKLGGITSSVQVGVTLVQNVPVVRQAAGSLRGTIDQLEVRVNILRLVAVTDKGDTFNNNAEFTLEYKATKSSTWLPFIPSQVTPPVRDPRLWGSILIPSIGVFSPGDGRVSVRGKTSTGYVKEFRVDVPRMEDDDWEVRIVKLSRDDHKEDIVDLAWESFQCTNKTALTYPNTAIVHGLGVANGQFSSIPEFSGIYDGLLIRVPSNYNADLHTYDDSSPWNGSFKFAWTDNPAWILYDLITNTRYGLAKHRRYLDANRFTFYEAARWCDTPVKIGGTTNFRPRYTFNDVILEPRPGMELLQYVAGSFNALVWDDLQGQIHLRVDKDDPAVQIFTPENTGAEGFSYTFTDITTRANDVSVSFINPDLNWVEDRRRISGVTTNEESITKHGRIPLDFIAVGCTNLHEAIAKAQVRLLSALTETTMVSFNTARQGALLSLYDVILIADPVMGWSKSGRFTHYDSEFVYFRDPIYMETTGSLTMKVQTQTGIIEVTVVPEEIGHVTRLKMLGSQLPTNLPRYAVFTLEQADGFGFGKPFRVLGLDEVEGSPYVYRITAVEINRNKYVLSEEGTPLDEPQYSYQQPVVPGQPTNFVATSGDNHIYITPSGEVVARILCSWRKSQYSIVKNFELQYRNIKDEAWQSIMTSQTEQYISPAIPGETYVMRVASYDPSGNRSPWATIDDHLAKGKTVIPVALTSISATGGIFQNEVTWTFNNSRDLGKTQIWASNTVSFSDAAIVADLSYPTNKWLHVALGVGKKVYYWGRVQDTSGNYSAFVGPTSAETVKDPAVFLEILHGSITELELFDDLKERINLIDAGPGVPLSVANRIQTETLARIAAVQEETDARIEDINQEIEDRIAAIQGEAGARVAYVTNYTYSKAETDQSISISADALTTSYRAYADAGRDQAISDAAADVRNYSYSKANSDLAEAAQTNSITTSYQTYATGKRDEAISSAAADVRSYAYSKTTSDSALAAQSVTLTTAYTGAIETARQSAIGVANADVRNYSYSKSSIDAADAAVFNNLTTNYQVFANNVGTNAVLTAAANTTTYAYSKSATDGAIATLGSTLRSEFSSTPGVATESFVQNYTYSKATVDSAFSSQFTSLTSNYTNYVEGRVTDVVNYSNSQLVNYSYSKAETNSAIASATSTLSTTVGTHTTSLQIQQSSIDGLHAQYSVKVNNNGRVAGFGLSSTPINGVPTSAFIISADRFGIGFPGYDDKLPFVVGQVNGVAAIGLAGVAIVDDAITARHIDVVSLSAISAIIGDLQTATSGARTRIRDNNITLYDSANNVIMVIGEF